MVTFGMTIGSSSGGFNGRIVIFGPDTVDDVTGVLLVVAIASSLAADDDAA